MQLRDTTHFTTRFLLPIVAATGFTILALAGFLAWSAQRIDSDAREREQRLLEHGIDELEARMFLAQDELATWDEAVTAVEDGDTGWLVDNLGVYAYDTFGHNRVYVVDAQLKPIMAVRDGGQVPAKTANDELAKLRPLYDTLRNIDTQATIAAYNAGVQDKPPQAMGFTHFEGHPALVAAMPILSYSGENAPVVGTEAFYISVVLLNDTLARRLGDQYRIASLHFVETEPGPSALPVLGSDGTPIAWLTWQPEQPGARLIEATLPALFGALVIGVIIVVLLLRSLRSALGQLQAEREEASHRALHDPLTGLGNRSLFRSRVAEGLSAMQSGAPRLAVLALDLDQFKQVNDTMGHQAGDELLVEIATRIERLLRPEDTFTRLGGDEFAIVQPGITSHDEPRLLAQSIIDVLARPVPLSAGLATISASIGIATAPDFARDETELVRFADDALYMAKNGGRNRYCLYAPPAPNEPGRLDAQLRNSFATRRASA